MKIEANAKINLFLEVLNKREDGYHNIETVMQEIALRDELEIEEIKSDEITLEIKGIKLSNKDNLVYKAAKLIKDEYNIKNGVKIILTKNIPIGAGLGGGSSDAAAAIKGLSKLWGLNLSRDEMIRLGTGLGADVPFFFYGGRCLARGIGEKIEVLDNKDNYKIILVYPNIHISTKEVYSKISFALTNNAKKGSILSVYTKQDSSLISSRFFFNRLEEIAFSLAPKIEEIKEELLLYPVDGALMSGSGSAVFAITNKADVAESIEKDFSNRGYCVWVTETV